MSNKMYSFASHKCFYEYIHKVLPLFEVRESVSKGRFTFIYDGQVKPYRNLYQFLGELNGLLEKDLFLIKPSRILSRTRYKIFVDSEVEENLNGTEVVVEKHFVEGTGEAVMPSHYAPVISTSEEEKEFEVDWEWIESLEDTPESKLALDEYAEKYCNIKLRRNLKLVNMIRNFKKALSE